MAKRAYSKWENFLAALQVEVAGGDQAPAIIVDTAGVGPLSHVGEFQPVLQCTKGLSPRQYTEIPGLSVNWDGGKWFILMDSGGYTIHNIAKINRQFYG